MVYTRYKCDRVWMYWVKYWGTELPQGILLYAFSMSMLWKHTGFLSEEEERKEAWPHGYPYQRDPIARRNTDKSLRLIRDNNIDIEDPIWTGVPKSAL